MRSVLEEAGVAYTSPVVLAELTSKYARSHGSDDARRRVAHVTDHSVVIDDTLDIGIAAGEIHAQLKPKISGIGLADCFVLAAARSKGARILTGDPHFEGLPDAEML